MLTKEVLDTLSDAQGDAHIIPHSPQDSLAKTLQTHLAIIDWQQESWRSYMSSLEQDLRSKLDHLDDLMQHLTGHNEADINCQEQFEHKTRRLRTLRANSWKELQQLNLLSSNLKKAKVTMTCNNVTLKELNEYYSILFEPPSVPESIRTDCAKNMREFTIRMGALERSIESECLSRADEMTGGQLTQFYYALILKEQRKETERQFALSSKDSMERMEQETSSMHTITTSTLNFLPGTFIGAYF
ncbi:hypothetical protein PFICI_08889 [Pestalotiopsis fici W106-1]|uniref:CorA-like transporter domain-containing protein n=1 Tax=Pestalotiopsis fici (strain W106-1 / CGMCC3.15140) TaxID=1229662 RepID=W3X1I8_PESFW|nr:uncharacterized protein PFICI_08889 [Pestalotiopsis fici W106-1]ETS79036.1 hypothetical protein PFICI_08889 [Pestalotiopsis fici W106-1]